MEQQPRSWSHLPDVCLLLVFKKLSTSDMIRSVGRVCTNWAQIQRVELQNRTSLVIVGERPESEDGSEEHLLSDLRTYSNPFGSDMIEHVRREDGTAWAVLPSLQQIKFDVVRVIDSFAKGNIIPLMDKLPNITHLTVKLWHGLEWPISHLEQVTRLTNHYANSLISLRIEIIPSHRFGHSRIYKYDPAFPSRILALFDSINRLDSLRHLTLSVTMHNSVEPQLFILSRLTNFTSNEFTSASSLLASLRQYATGDNLRVECGAEIPFNEAIQLNPQLATKFTRIHVVGVFSESQYENMREFCDRFVSLHSLWIDAVCPSVGDMSMPMLARCLSQLPQLIHLKLNLLRIPQDEYPPVHEIVPVASVRLLTLKYKTYSHLDTERLHLAQIFPGLQVLHLNQRIFGCNKCDYPFDADAMHPQIVHCMHLARQPFRQCANLHTVKLDSDDEELRSLLPQGLITRDQL